MFVNQNVLPTQLRHHGYITGHLIFIFLKLKRNNQLFIPLFIFDCIQAE